LLGQRRRVSAPALRRFDWITRRVRSITHVRAGAPGAAAPARPISREDLHA
jgi:hypothetical protein